MVRKLKVRNTLKVNKTIRIGGNTIIITKDFIDLAKLTSDPSLSDGRLWYNDSEKTIKTSIQNEAYRVAPIPILLGVAKSGWIFNAGQSINVQPFTGDAGSSYGMPLSFKAIIRNLVVQIIGNSLNDDGYVRVRQNEANTSLYVTIPSGETGIFENTSTLIYFDRLDRIDFFLDFSIPTEGSIDIASITVEVYPI